MDKINNEIVIIGIGEMGSVFARGFLRLGRPVFPLTRNISISSMIEKCPNPEMVLVALGEGDLHSMLEKIPKVWMDRVVLLQNELLPVDWDKYGFINPTLISVWFEKKSGREFKVIIPSPAYGPNALLLQSVLNTLDIPVTILQNSRDLLLELVIKNLYILTTNIAGLIYGGTVGELWRDHSGFVLELAEDIIKIQEYKTESIFDHDVLVKSMILAFEGDPNHNCMGRSALARLKGALESAKSFKLSLPTIINVSKQLQP
jgi:hypothetical protein